MEDKNLLLREFWTDRKHLFEIVGTSFVIGALFLTLPSPTDPAAIEALNYVKLAWLAIIMAGLALLVYQVFTLALKIEDTLVARKVDFFGTFGLATALVGLALLYAIPTGFLVKNVLSCWTLALR